jgi:hypothetical protein
MDNGSMPATARRRSRFVTGPTRGSSGLADIDVQGHVMLVPDLHARITLLDAGNQVIAHLGDDPAWRKRVLDRKEKMRASRPKWQPGRFVHPHDAVFDHAGNIFVAEWVITGRVTKLRRLS